MSVSVGRVPFSGFNFDRQKMTFPRRAPITWPVLVLASCLARAQGQPCAAHETCPAADEFCMEDGLYDRCRSCAGCTHDPNSAAAGLAACNTVCPGRWPHPPMTPLGQPGPIPPTHSYVVEYVFG